MESAAPLPNPEAIRNLAAEIISRPDYKLDPVDATWYQRIADFLKWVTAPLLNWFHSLWAISPALAIFTLIVLFIILIALIVHIAYSFKVALGGDAHKASTRNRQAEMEAMPETWEKYSRESAAKGDFIGAVRHLFFAGLLALEQSQKRNIRRGSTNREYLRRFRNTPAHEPLKVFVEIIDVKWYGGGSCVESDYAQASGAYADIRRMTRETANANRA
jgi:hypothetical protein